MHFCLWQGLFEVSGGLGFAVGPPIGGLLYAVEYLNMCMHLVLSVNLVPSLLVALMLSPVNARYMTSHAANDSQSEPIGESKT